MNDIILVNEEDIEIGQGLKLPVHKAGLLHRAFSVMLWRKTGSDIEVLLQQRQLDKYHCGGLWTNACCSHPRPGEAILAAAERRLQEEMGIQTKLQEIGVFQYRAEFDNGLIEHEIDHVFLGHLSYSQFDVNPEEVSAIQWIKLSALPELIKQQPQIYTPWLNQVVEITLQHFI